MPGPTNSPPPPTPGLSTYTALHLLKTALLPKMLWASRVWWTGSQHILNRLEPVYHQALRWATGLPKYESNKKLYPLSRSPPLQCILDLLSARYATRLLFAPVDHPLRELIQLPGRKIQQPWLDWAQPLKSAYQYSTLKRPLPHHPPPESRRHPRRPVLHTGASQVMN